MKGVSCCGEVLNFWFPLWPSGSQSVRPWKTTSSLSWFQDFLDNEKWSFKMTRRGLGSVIDIPLKTSVGAKGRGVFFASKLPLHAGLDPFTRALGPAAKRRTTKTSGARTSPRTTHSGSRRPLDPRAAPTFLALIEKETRTLKRLKPPGRVGIGVRGEGWKTQVWGTPSRMVTWRLSPGSGVLDGGGGRQGRDASLKTLAGEGRGLILRKFI